MTLVNLKEEKQNLLESARQWGNGLTAQLVKPAELSGATYIL
jgi:hypothetical protein